MSLISKLVGMIVAGRTIVDTVPMFQKLMRGIAMVVGLAVVSGILAGVLLVGVIYAAYAALVDHGLEAGAAMMIIGGIVLVVTGLLVRQVLVSIEKIKMIPQQVLVKQNPLAQKAARMGNAFLDGLLSTPQTTDASSEAPSAGHQERRAANLP